MRPSALAAIVVAFPVFAGSAGPSAAKIPDPRFSTIPEVLNGSPSGALLPSCGPPGSQADERTACFRVVLRDIANAPLAYNTVVLDLSKTPCRLYADDRPGTTVNCAAGTISRLTGLDGTVEFAARFSGGCTEALVMVLADGVPLREIPARSTDLDSDGATNLPDLSRVALNYLGRVHDAATDFDPCAGEPGITSLADLSVFSRVYLGGGTGSVCP